MKGCPQCGGTGSLREAPLTTSTDTVPVAKCLAEHVELIRCPYDPRLCKAHEGHGEPFYADPSSVMWWCRVHRCSMPRDPATGQPTSTDECWWWAFLPFKFPTDEPCDVVPADEPVTYELWKEKTQ